MSWHQNTGVRSILERLRYVIVIAVAGLTITTVGTLVWAVARGVDLIVVVAAGGWRQDAPVVNLLQVIDLFLVATVQLLVALGLYELFVEDLTLPSWLTVRNLDELKRPIVQVLVVILAIKFLERALGGDARDILYYGAAIAVVIASLVAFLRWGGVRE